MRLGLDKLTMGGMLVICGQTVQDEQMSQNKPISQKLGDLVQFDVDGGKPARNPRTIFGFDLVSPLGRKIGPKVVKEPPKENEELEP